MPRRGDYIDRTGIAYGGLTVVGMSRVEYDPDDRRNVYHWKCSCFCGRETEVIGSNLNKLPISCGCVAYGKRSPDSFFRRLKERVIAGARKRGFDYSLSDEELRMIVKKDCYYCGAAPTLKECYKRTGKDGQFPFNGVDRADSSRGYISGNCVPCCPQCNWMKSDMSDKEFLAHIERILRRHA